MSPVDVSWRTLKAASPGAVKVKVPGTGFPFASTSVTDIASESPCATNSVCGDATSFAGVPVVPGTVGSLLHPQMSAGTASSTIERVHCFITSTSSWDWKRGI